MKKAGVILLICVGIALVIFILMILYPSLSAKYVKNQLLKLNYCEVKEDCVIVYGKCPIGAVGVNKNEANKTKNLMKLVPITCTYSLAYYEIEKCEFGRCVLVQNRTYTG